MTTLASYALGPPRRPVIRHDDGFLDRFAPRAPTSEERRDYALWQARAELGEAVQGVPFMPHNALPDALAAYRHFLGASGRTRRVNLERYVANDQSGRTFLRNAIVEGRLAAHSVHRRIAGEIPAATFRFTGTALTAGGGVARFPYPATENWLRAIGAFSFRLGGEVEVERTAARPEPRFVLDLTVHVEDMHNFNPGAADIATGIPDDANGVFEITGLAKQYLNRGSVERTVAWAGAPQGTSSDVEGAPFLRPRRPQDNRRIRNRA